MRILLAAMLFGLAAILAGVWAAPASAQMPPINLLGAADKPKDPVEEERREQIDRAYRARQGQQPAQQQANDPWANVRDKPKPK